MTNVDNHRTGNNHVQKRCALAVSVRTLTVEKRTNMYVPVLKSVIVSSRPIHWSTLVEKLEVKLAKDSMVTCRSYLLSHSNRNHNYDPRHVGRAFLPCVSFDTHACTLARRFPHALLSSSKRTGGLYKDLKHTPVISSTKSYYVTIVRVCCKGNVHFSPNKQRTFTFLPRPKVFVSYIV